MPNIPDAVAGATITEAWGDAVASALNGGVAFPAAPDVGQRFWRTDRAIEYSWNGTRWVSRLYIDNIPSVSDALLPIGATGTNGRVSSPYLDVYDKWLEAIELSVFIGAGTALAAAHKWAIQFFTGATLQATINLDSGANGARTVRQAINALSGTAAGTLAWRVDYTKTGTPGTLIPAIRIAYRLVG